MVVPLTAADAVATQVVAMTKTTTIAVNSVVVSASVVTGRLRAITTLPRATRASQG